MKRFSSLSSGLLGVRYASSPLDFRSLLAKQGQQAGAGSQFDGQFCGGDGMLDGSAIANMQKTLRASMTPEMMESMRNAVMQNGPQGLSDMEGGGMMGMMAFGMGENEKGKRVARAAKMTMNMKTGKMEHDFREEQLDPDDECLPKQEAQVPPVGEVTEVEFVDESSKRVGR